MNPRVELSSPLCSAAIIPEEGGRIQHLVDRSSGRELLLQRTPAEGPRTDFLAACAGGWDELFPNDSAWRAYPDHGLLWTLPFKVQRRAGSAMEMSAAVASPNVTIARRVALLEAPRRGLRSEIVLSALEATGPFLWAAHPMLAVSEGWVVELPSTAANLEADVDLPGRLGTGRALTRSDWKRVSGIPPVSAEVGEVVYVDGVAEATVRSGDGRAATRVSWESSFFRHLWIVIITGAYGLDDCLILEPCTTRPYRLDEAVQAGSSLQLDRAEVVRWWIEVESLDPPP